MSERAAMNVVERRQLAHWVSAAHDLVQFQDQASPDAWGELERYVQVELRRSLATSVERLLRIAARAESLLVSHAVDGLDHDVGTQILQLRSQYLRTETLLDFYADAINTRTNPAVGARLRGCDILASLAMRRLLRPLGHGAPPVLTYLDRGLGASILKAGLRLWDGSTESPVAAIKITRHNLHRPTSLLHEAGHQVNHILGLNKVVADRILADVGRNGERLALIWSGWTSELLADAFAFAHSGYGAIAALEDVVSGGQNVVFRWLPADPHPIGFVRVLVGYEMCRRYLGRRGPWSEAERLWRQSQPLSYASARVRSLLQAILPQVPHIVDILLGTPYEPLGQRPIVGWIRPPSFDRDLIPVAALDGDPLRQLAVVAHRAAIMPEVARDRADWLGALARPASNF